MGRGASDDKGPLLAWICILRAHKELGLELPINLKMVFEGMEGKSLIDFKDVFASVYLFKKNELSYL
jgi:acetylornithine deacetylase/succinyl-diaminopimelate desuccinylase-like protein